MRDEFASPLPTVGDWLIADSRSCPSPGTRVCQYFGDCSLMPTTIHNSDASEAGILARLLSEGSGQKLPRGLARYILELGFSHEDKQRMHDLAIRNQIDSLSPEEREELLAYAKAGT